MQVGGALELLAIRDSQVAGPLLQNERTRELIQLAKLLRTVVQLFFSPGTYPCRRPLAFYGTAS